MLRMRRWSQWIQDRPNTRHGRLRRLFRSRIDGNYNAALADRQPGSAFKPFVYAAASPKGYTPHTAIFDLPTQFSTHALLPITRTTRRPAIRRPTTTALPRPDDIHDGARPVHQLPAVKVLYLAGIQNVINLATAWASRASIRRTITALRSRSAPRKCTPRLTDA